MKALEQESQGKVRPVLHRALAVNSAEQAAGPRYCDGIEALISLCPEAFLPKLIHLS